MSQSSKPCKDTILENHPESDHLERRKALLQTIKEIYTNYTSNMNYYADKNHDSISLLSHVKKKILDKMMFDHEQKQKNLKESRKNQTVVYSSESEQDSQSQQKTDIRELFRSVIDDYAGETNQSGAFHKTMIKAIEKANENNSRDINREKSDDSTFLIDFLIPF